MNDNTRAHGLNRAERLPYPGAVPTTHVQPDSPDYLKPRPEPAVATGGGPLFHVEERMANDSAITVKTRVDVVPGERLSAADRGYSPRSRKANWRDYRGR